MNSVYNILMELPNFYSKISIQGLDAEKFLQGQLTCDLQKANIEQAILGAHCNPKGRIISLFFLLRTSSGFDLLMPSDLLILAFTNLQKYAQFFKQITLQKEAVVNWCPAQLKKESDLSLAHIEAGIPLVHTQTSGLFLPHDINLPQLGGVSFDKGCYTGQEIIARMQNLGRPKQHLYRLNFEAQAGQRVFPPSAKIYLPAQLESEVGIIVEAAFKENSMVALASLKDVILVGEGPVWAMDLVVGKERYRMQLSAVM
jgi:folate-binding protein YgfZ